MLVKGAPGRQRLYMIVNEAKFEWWSLQPTIIPNISTRHQQDIDMTYSRRFMSNRGLADYLCNRSPHMFMFFVCTFRMIRRMKWILPVLIIFFTANGLLLQTVQQHYWGKEVFESLRRFIDTHMPYADMPRFDNILCFPKSSVDVNKSDIIARHDASLDSILTLFTTCPNFQDKRYIYENTITNWHLLSPDVIPILFTDDHPSDPRGIAYIAAQQGWHVLPIPATSPGGIPVLRHMYLTAQKKFYTTFYGYANCDILFDRNLTDTLRSLQTYAYGGHIDKLLVVGRRRNWSVEKGVNLAKLSMVGHYMKNSSLYISDAQDYFLTTRHGYPWTCIPDFVVGRIGYDNWLVVAALVNQIPVVDATETVTALHQTGEDGNLAGWQAMSERHINKDISRRFDYTLGHVTCGQFTTQRKNGTIIITERNLNGKTCNNRKVPLVRSPFMWEMHECMYVHGNCYISPIVYWCILLSS